MSALFEVTGWGTIVLAWLLAVVVMTLVVRSWARLAQPGLRSVLLRVVALLLVTFSLALAIGTAANRAGLWFVSWRDLGSVLGGPDPAAVRALGADPRVAATTDLGPWGPASAPVVASAAPTPDATTVLQAYTVTGPTSGHTGMVYAWTAPGEPREGRPAVQVFHGYPVSAQSAFANLALAEYVGRALPGAVVIVPDWSPGEVDTECVDGPAAQMETWLTTDVPAWAVATFGVKPERESWAALGYSAGGWCASMAAVRHPQTYAAAISLGGYTRPLFSSHYEPTPPVGGAYDLPRLVAATPPAVALLTQFSEKDHYAGPTTADFLAAVKPPLSVTEWATPDAGHRVGAWKPMIPDALTWLRQTSPGFA